MQVHSQGRQLQLILVEKAAQCRSERYSMQVVTVNAQRTEDLNRMLTYPLFIDEVRALRADIDNLRAEPGLSNSIPFKTWRHALITLLDQMLRNGYSHIGCSAQARSFRPDGWSTEHPANYFHSALHDTVIELDNLISSWPSGGIAAISDIWHRQCSQLVQIRCNSAILSSQY